MGGSHINCIKNKCIHSSLVKSVIGVIEAKLYSFLKTYKKVDLFVCPSNFLANKLISSKKFYKDKTFTIHNFINKKEFTQKNDSTEPYIVFVGRLSKEKGVDYLAKVASLLPEYKFMVAGDGPDKGVLCGVDNIDLKGFLKGDELTSLMGNAKILLLPSVCYENCPLSILEAHAMGVPVVTMKSGGMAELVDDGVTGTLADVPTAECIAKKIKETIENAAYYNKIKENCINKKEKILDVENYCSILLEKYTELIER